MEQEPAEVKTLVPDKEKEKIFSIKRVGIVTLIGALVILSGAAIYSQFIPPKYYTPPLKFTPKPKVSTQSSKKATPSSQTRGIYLFIRN